MHINETKLQKINKNTKSVCFEFQVHSKLQLDHIASYNHITNI